VSATFRLAHVTDPHFRSFQGARLGEFLGKRAVGALNVMVNRRRKHKMELLESMGEDLRRERFDHLAVTGDLSNVSLAAEWREARRWLDALDADPEAVTVIPGNHDAYVADVVARQAFEQVFAPFQTWDAAMTGGGGARAPYPFVRLRGPTALVGVTSCVATGDLGAWGQVGEAQLGALERALTSPGLAGRVRVVLIHHPPIRQKGGEERNLKDRAALAAVLARAGAELVLHGHDHVDQISALTGPGGRPIPVVGAGSASYSGRPERRARYNVYEIADGAITLTTRAHDEETDAFREVRRERLV
jgi:3',5'-cyclic AMP phosphodiesterase CpdA